MGVGSSPLPLSPTSLPTIAEIRACTNFLWEARCSKVVALNNNIVVKCGFGWKAGNVWLRSILKRVPEVPAPRLYAIYYNSNELFMIMQGIPGVPLNPLWAYFGEVRWYIQNER